MKNTTLIRILAAMLCAASVVMTASCGDSSSSAPASTTAAEQQGEAAPAADEPEETTFRYSLDTIDVKDYGGRVFRTYTTDNDPVEIEEQTGDVVDDAQYKRNLEIEEKYNIKFKDSTIPLGDYDNLRTTFRQSVMAQSDDFDVCRMVMRHAFACALEGYVLPVTSLTYTNLENPWYVKYVNEALTIGGTQYLAYSDECLDVFTGASCVFFNKYLIENLSLTSPYDDVRNNAWTVDRYYADGVAAISDINGDGNYTMDGGDRFAVVGEYDGYLPPIWIGADMMLIKKDADDVPYFAALGNDKFYSLIEKMQEYFEMDGFYWDDFLKVRFHEDERIVGRQHYMNDQALFYLSGFGSASGFRSMEHDFGIVPTPKYDESQSEYFSRIADGWLLNVPVHCTDTEFVSAILEELAIGTKNYIIPAYYEDAMKNKYIRDDETLEMLEIIQNNKNVDLGDTIWFETVRSKFCDTVFVNGKPVASSLEKMEKSVNKTIDKALNPG